MLLRIFTSILSAWWTYYIYHGVLLCISAHLALVKSCCQFEASHDVSIYTTVTNAIDQGVWGFFF